MIAVDEIGDWRLGRPLEDINARGRLIEPGTGLDPNHFDHGRIDRGQHLRRLCPMQLHEVKSNLAGSVVERDNASVHEDTDSHRCATVARTSGGASNLPGFFDGNLATGRRKDQAEHLRAGLDHPARMLGLSKRADLDGAGTDHD